MADKFKVRCIKSGTPEFVVGKLYEFDGEHFRNDNGYNYTAWRKKGATQENLIAWFSTNNVNFEKVEETPREFKVGDRVRITEEGYREWENLREKGVDLGTIIIYNNKFSIGIEFDKNFGGHDCGNKDCKYGHGFWLEDKDIELVKEEPKSEPTPTPVVNVNVTVNLYENACWYCRKGGLVDLYLAGAMGICPSCGRVCNNTVPTKPKKDIVIEFKTPEKPKENKPLTTEELKALPKGTRVFSVWLDGHKKPRPHDSRTCWRTVVEGGLDRKHGNVGFTSNGSSYYTYLEMPEGYVDNDP